MNVEVHNVLLERVQQQAVTEYNLHQALVQVAVAEEHQAFALHQSHELHLAKNEVMVNVDERMRSLQCQEAAACNEVLRTRAAAADYQANLTTEAQEAVMSTVIQYQNSDRAYLQEEVRKMM